MTYVKETSKGISVFHTDEEQNKGFDKFVFLSRFEYKAHYHNIKNSRQLRAVIREGKFSFPGGYAVIPYTSDGDALCLDCIKENLSSCLWSIRNNVKDGWRVVGLDTYWGLEDNGETVCSNCGKDWETI